MVFVNNSLYFDVNKFISIYHLKCLIQDKTSIKIDDQCLYFNGMSLKDNVSLKEYNIQDNDNLLLSKSLNGGFDTLSLLMWLLYICAFLLYLIILISGIIPIIAHTYGYLLNWSIQKIGNILNISDKRYFEIFKFILMFIVSITIVYYFVYATTAFIVFPLMYARFDEICKGIILSDKIGFWVAIFFIITYAIFNIPNFFLNIGSDISKTNVILQTILNPIIKISEGFANIGKFAGIYAIPFLGTPFLDGYHFAVGLLSTFTVETADLTHKFNCDSIEQMRELGIALRNDYKQNPVVRDWINSYGASELVDSISIGLIPTLKEWYKCKYDEAPIWGKFSGDAGKYMVSKYVTDGFCFALKFVRAISDILNSMGGSASIANMIRTGNMGGVIGFIVLIITLILAMLNIM